MVRPGCISATISYLARLVLLWKVVTCAVVVIGMKAALVKVKEDLNTFLAGSAHLENIYVVP